MKKLFSDGVVAKLRSFPSVIWVLFLLVSFYFAKAYELLLDAEYYAFAMAEAYKELGVELNTVTMGVIFSIVESAVYLVIFEIIASILYNWAVGRFRCQINKQDFKFRLRYYMILVNLIIGVLSVGYFFTQFENGVIAPNIRFFGDKLNRLKATNPYYDIQSSVLPFVVYALTALAFYQDFRARFVPKRNQAQLFSRFGMIFVGVSFALFLYKLVSNLLLIENPTVSVSQIIAYSLEGFSYVAISIGYYFYYRKLKKESFEPTIVIPDDRNGGGNDKIFEDFGF